MTKRPRILFVDDEKGILDALQRMFRHERKAWDMEFVDSSRRAMERIEAERFDAVVSDMRMPNMDGASLLQLVREKTPETLRFILSGQADEISIIRSAVACHQYLAKPCSATVLRDSIARALAFRDPVENADVRRTVAGLIAVPSLEGNIDELRMELQRERPDMQRLTRLVAQDIGLCAKYLQFASSAMFGDHGHIQSFDQLTHVASTHQLKALFSRDEYSETLIEHAPDAGWIASLRERSGRVAQLTVEIMKCIRPDDKRAHFDACLAGTLHEIGTLILAYCFGPSYTRMASVVHSQGQVLESLEAIHYGCDHAQVGAMLLAIWGCPSSIVNAVSTQHQRVWSSLSHEAELGFSLSLAHCLDRAQCVSSLDEFQELRGNTLLQKYPALVAWCDRIVAEQASLTAPAPSLA